MENLLLPTDRIEAKLARALRDTLEAEARELGISSRYYVGGTCECLLEKFMASNPLLREQVLQFVEDNSK